jgi:hypothetical protein
MVKLATHEHRHNYKGHIEQWLEGRKQCMASLDITVVE